MGNLSKIPWQGCFSSVTGTEPDPVVLQVLFELLVLPSMTPHVPPEALESDHVHASQHDILYSG